MTAGLRALPLLARATGLVGDVPSTGWRQVELGEGTTGELWRPRRRPTGPPFVLAVGLTPQGPADPRVRRVAHALARAGRSVFVPRLALSDRDLTTDDVDRIVDGVRAVDAGRGVVALGFSVGGSYSLIAAADDRVRGRLRAVASFGAYADLLAYLSVMRPKLRAQGDLADLIAGYDVVAPEEREQVVAVLEGRADVDELPTRLLTLARRLSPVTYAGQVDVPVVLLHASGDETVPDRELRLLARSFPHAEVHSVELFTHVDLRTRPGRVVELLRDLRTVWRFAVAVLES